MKSDLSNVKVGDKIWTIQEGWTEVARIDTSSDFCIETRHDCYLPDGRNLHGDKHPSAFLSSPFERDSSQVIVGDNFLEPLKENPFEKGITREVEEKIIKGFTSWLANWLANDKGYYYSAFVSEYLDQKYKPLPTAEEAAEKLGITVEQLKQISNG